MSTELEKEHSKLALIKEWANLPLHAWIKNSPDWLERLSILWTALSASAIQEIFSKQKKIFFIPPPECPQVLRLQISKASEVYLLQLHTKLLTIPADETTAILAHELAHLCVEPTENPLINDFNADDKVYTWGLGDALYRALKRDLGISHARTQRIDKLRNEDSFSLTSSGSKASA
jgi:hypothetical protein